MSTEHAVEFAARFAADEEFRNEALGGMPGEVAQRHGLDVTAEELAEVASRLQSELPALTEEQLDSVVGGFYDWVTQAVGGAGALGTQGLGTTPQPGTQDLATQQSMMNTIRTMQTLSAYSRYQSSSMTSLLRNWR